VRPELAACNSSGRAAHYLSSMEIEVICGRQRVMASMHFQPSSKPASSHACCSAGAGGHPQRQAQSKQHASSAQAAPVGWRASLT
jgi:hypothetical protein